MNRLAVALLLLITLASCFALAAGPAETSAVVNLEGPATTGDEQSNEARAEPQSHGVSRADMAPAGNGPPANDDFANASDIPPYSDDRDTSGATVETGEPQPCGNIGATVWYKYVAGEDDRWEAQTRGSDFDTVLAVYTGTSLDNLTLIDCNNDASYLQSIVDFDAATGETYYFQVGGRWGTTGLLDFDVTNTCGPPFPGTYAGEVLIDGSPAPAGTLIRASIQGWQCGTNPTSGGSYALDCPQSSSSEPPCFRSGWLSFNANRGPCEPVVEWSGGLHSDHDLTCRSDAVGGIAGLPEVYDSSTPKYVALAALAAAAAALVPLAAGVWYARRRWLA